MTIQDLIDVLDEFRDEYNTSPDPYIQKLCGFVTNTINGLNSYISFFQNSKSEIQNNQKRLEESVLTIDKLLDDYTAESANTDHATVNDNSVFDSLLGN